MKRIFSLLGIALLSVATMAQTTMTVNKKDGTRVTIALDNYVNTTFGDDEVTQPEVITQEVEVPVTPFDGTTELSNIRMYCGTVSTKLTHLGGDLWTGKVKDPTTFFFRHSDKTIVGSTAINMGADLGWPSGTGIKSNTGLINGKLGEWIVFYNAQTYAYQFIPADGTANKPDTIIVEKPVIVNPDEPWSGELRTLTFEDSDYRGSGNIVSDDLTKGWSTLIDDQQYGGDLLYGSQASTYMWYDENNTELCWDGFNDAGYGVAFWNGGYAVSNYYMEDYSSATYAEQLALAMTQQDNNFCVAFNREDSYGGKDVNPIYFADNKARTIRSIDVANIAYVVNSLANGDSFSTPAQDGSRFTVNIRGTQADGNTTLVQHHLCVDTNVQMEWQTVDCTSLGKVTKIEIFLTASEDLCGDWGMNTPGYCAFDNIVVEF